MASSKRGGDAPKRARGPKRDYVEILDSVSDGEAEANIKSLAPAGELIQGDGGGLWSQEVAAVIQMQTLMGLFYSEPWVYITIDRYASMIAGQPLRVYRRVKGTSEVTVEPMYEHQVNRILEQPNDYQDYHAFMYALAVQYCILGNSCINWQAINKRLIPLATENVNMTFDHKSHKILRYDVLGASAADISTIKPRMSYKPEEIIHIRRPNPGSLVWGLSPFIPGRKSVLFDRYSQEYLLNFYVKGAQPGIVMSLDKDANEKAALRLLASWQKTQSGRKNQRKEVLLPKGVTASSLDQKLADQQLIEYVKQNREVILNILGVPKHVLSIAEAGSLGSEEAKMAIKYFWSGVLRPAQKIIAGAITRAMRIHLDDNMFLDFDNSDVDVLQEDQFEKAELAEKMLATHTVNELRAELYKKEPIEGGDKLNGAQQANPFGSFGGFGGGGGAFPPRDPKELAAAAEEGDEQAQQQLEQLEAGEDPNAGKLEGEEKALPEGEEKALESGHISEGDNKELSTNMTVVDGQSAILNGQYQPLSVNEKNLQRLEALKAGGDWWKRRMETKLEPMAKAEDAIAEAVIDLYIAQGKAAIKAMGSGTKSLSDRKTRLKAFNKAKVARELAKASKLQKDPFVVIFEETLQETLISGFKGALISSFESLNPARLEAIEAPGIKQRRAMLEDRGLRTFAYISETNTERIMKLVADGVLNGFTVESIAEAILGIVGDKNPVGRANTIARTETFMASSLGEMAAMQAAAKDIKGLKKAWITAGDVDVRDTHKPLQGEVRPYKKAFSNGLMHPHDPSGPAHEVINCRCTLLIVPPEDANAIGLEELAATLPGPNTEENPRPK